MYVLNETQRCQTGVVPETVGLHTSTYLEPGTRSLAISTSDDKEDDELDGFIDQSLLMNVNKDKEKETNVSYGGIESTNMLRVRSLSFVTKIVKD